MPTATSQVILGAFETVSLPELGIVDTIAKIDTGAYSGAIHCSEIKEVVHDDGRKVLRFTPSDNHSHATEIDHFISTYVRSSTGHRVKRYLFDTNIVIHDKTYTIRIGLTNRSDMKYEILIGRRFLREHGMLVDVRINQEYDTDGAKQL